jgi:hypothetical protein
MPHLASVALFWLSAVCAVVASLAVVWSVRPRHAAGGPTHGVGDLVWAVLPTLALLVILALTWRAVRP